MKRTLYLSEEAEKVLATKKNKSRYVCDLIIADYSAQNKPRTDIDIVSIISLLLENKRPTSENIASRNDMLESLNQMLDM